MIDVNRGMIYGDSLNVIFSGNPETIRCLLTHVGDTGLTLRNYNGQTPLAVALQRNHQRCSEILRSPSGKKNLESYDVFVLTGYYLKYNYITTCK